MILGEVRLAQFRGSRMLFFEVLDGNLAEALGHPDGLADLRVRGERVPSVLDALPGTVLRPHPQIPHPCLVTMFPAPTSSERWRGRGPGQF